MQYSYYAIMMIIEDENLTLNCIGMQSGAELYCSDWTHINMLKLYVIV